MRFKYYHGTSTIFLDSIRKHGLGTINPNTDQKNLDVLKFLFQLSEKHLSTNPEFINDDIESFKKEVKASYDELINSVIK